MMKLTNTAFTVVKFIQEFIHVFFFNKKNAFDFLNFPKFNQVFPLLVPFNIFSCLHFLPNLAFGLLKTHTN